MLAIMAMKNLHVKALVDILSYLVENVYSLSYCTKSSCIVMRYGGLYYNSAALVENGLFRKALIPTSTVKNLKFV